MLQRTDGVESITQFIAVKMAVVVGVQRTKYLLHITIANTRTRTLTYAHKNLQKPMISGVNASWRLGGTSLVSRLPDWSELVASYSRMKTAWGWANGGQPILVCYIRKYVMILGDIPVDVPPTKILGDVSPASPAGLTPVPMLHTQTFHWQR